MSVTPSPRQAPQLQRHAGKGNDESCSLALPPLWHREAGVDRLVLRVVADDLDEMLEQLVRFKEQV